MAEQVAARCIDVDGHICLLAAQRTAASDTGDVISESLRVDGIAEGKKRGQLGKGLVVESIQVGQVTGLVDLVDIGLFRGELYVFADFVSNRPEELVIDELVNDGMFIRRGFGVFGSI
jgi:hypothetical protein